MEEQAKLVRSLKEDAAYGPQHDKTKEAISTLLELKKALPSTSSGSGSSSKAAKYQLKVPKGTKDWSDKDMILREQIFSTITRVFKAHGGVTLDTPVFELREILAGKYGEDSKLIYDLKDQGGELCSLRYDLTVPFARWLAMNPQVQSIKRFHIAKVYRRDQPAMTKGRMREFYQCDFDVAGTFESMVPDAEVLRITKEVLEALEIQNFTIKLNHRKILDGIFEVCGVPDDKTRTISSAVDKLDKLPWSDVRKEMIDEKGLNPAAADKIGEYVVLSGDHTLLQQLQQDARLTSSKKASEGLAEMETLFRYLKVMNVLPRIKFDLSLARGLDYYTGIIYEAVTAASAPKAMPSNKPVDKDADRSEDDSVGVGSIAAGGRYDHLVGMFTGKKQGVPCVGISIGVERVFSLLRARATAMRSNEVEVLVMAIGKTGLLEERMACCAELWEAGVKAEFVYKRKPQLRQQFEYADKSGIPVGVILGEEELAEGTVKVKLLGTGESNEGETVKRTEMASAIRKMLAEAAT
ncbi:mitochondrial and cytoplasmic histidine-tRNA ligase Hrs1 [Protomyces lactucae-debilis]|uniref:Histidine--tRNA ligase, mitochondrial n=1 Tax=Protomyces lactucae-debilis TaxID=2754530 RepID=A0A1Y2F8Z1_PROLT|nr:mitochondrial and cytoplasmic histidine-tRNA ligase Hrs1 [Protomyces lactucae-debilis]ORY80382.1 mitochondrial and cytoplasmic histidine-tRNA ligase Hrs1 [Protomyces lactucae-debilis]